MSLRLKSFRSLQQCRRYLHSDSLHDPSYFGLFEPQCEQSIRAGQGCLESKEDNEGKERETMKSKNMKLICMAFRDTFKEWSRTVPPEFISRPPAHSSRLFHGKDRRRTNLHAKGKLSEDESDVEDEFDDVAADDEEEEDEKHADVDEYDVSTDDDDDDDYDRHHRRKHVDNFSSDDDEHDQVSSDDDDDDYDDHEHDHVSGDDDEEDEHGHDHVTSDDVNGKDINTDAHHDLTLAHNHDAGNDKHERRPIEGMPDRDPESASEDINWDNLEGIDDEYDDSHTYYITESGKVRYKHLEIHAPKDEIYEKLSEAGLISSKFKKPLPVHKLVKKSDAEIVGWFYYCSIELLQFFRICHNLKEVKAIVEYHIRWSAICTLAKKHKCKEREIVRKYGRDLVCKDKKGKEVRLMSRQEIKQVTRGVNKRVQMTHRFRALRVLAAMD